MNKKEFIKCCQLLTNKEEFEQLKGTIKSLEYHLQNNFISGLKLGVKHSLLEKFATDTFEIEKKTKLVFGDFYRQYFFHNAFNDESRMDLVKHKILAYYANALEAQGEWLHYLTFSEQGIQSEWEQMLSHNGKQASAAGEKLSKCVRSFSATQEETKLDYKSSFDIYRKKLSLFNWGDSKYDEFVEEQNKKQHDAFIVTLTIALRKHLGREPGISDFKKCRIIYSSELPSHPLYFSYEGKNLVEFKHTSGIVNNNDEITYKHEIKIELL